MPVFIVALSCDERLPQDAKLVDECQQAFIGRLRTLGELTPIASSTWLMSSARLEMDALDESTSYLDPMLAKKLYYRLVSIEIGRCEQHQVTGNANDPKSQPLMRAVAEPIQKVPKGGWFS